MAIRISDYLNDLGDEIVFASSKKGFEFPPEALDQKLLLAVSEICEAQNEVRDGRAITEIYYEGESSKPCGFPVEIADAIIRLLHIARNFGIDIDKVINEKMAYNATRPMKHGRQF